MNNKLIRNNPGFTTYDPSSIENLTFNAPAGAKKVTEVGRHLQAVPYNNAGTIAYTTNLTTARPLPTAGKNIAVYNNSNTLGSITLGEDGTITVLASGVTDAAGHVGIPCAPNSWTYIACGSQQWVIASAATLLVYMVHDFTSVKAEY